MPDNNSAAWRSKTPRDTSLQAHRAEGLEPQRACRRIAPKVSNHNEPAGAAEGLGRETRACRRIAPKVSNHN